MTAGYHVRIGEQLIESWSVKVLPYEARDWRREWRDELRERLRGIGNGGDTPDTRFLAARYVSPVRDYACDAENVLFYNVGGAFAASTRAGLRFERLYDDPPPCPVELNGPPLHYHRYEVGEPNKPFGGWRESKPLASFEGVELPWIRPESKPVLVWFPLRNAGVQLLATGELGAEFALRLGLEVPPGAGAAASIVKPIFDGVIAALQAHDGTRTEGVAAWMERTFLGAFPGLTAVRAAELLTDYSMAALGPCCIFDRHGEGFACDPDDDRCVAGELVIRRGSRRSSFLLSGELNAVEPEKEWE